MKEIIYCLGYGMYLGVNKQSRSFVLMKKGEAIKELPFRKCNMIFASDGNTMSTNALFYAGVLNIDLIFMWQTGQLISLQRPINTDFEADARIAQYEAYGKVKGVRIAKEILLAKVQTQIEFLEAYGLNASKIYPHIKRIKDIKGKNLSDVRSNLNMVEANCTKVYFPEYISLLCFEKIPIRQLANKHGAKDIFNNVLNLSYEVLKAECFRACYNARLDPFLGFLHSTKHGKPAMVCDLQEFFRVEVNEFLYKSWGRIDMARIGAVSGREFL